MANIDYELNGTTIRNCAIKVMKVHESLLVIANVKRKNAIPEYVMHNYEVIIRRTASPNANRRCTAHQLVRHGYSMHARVHVRTLLCSASQKTNEEDKPWSYDIAVTQLRWHVIIYEYWKNNFRPPTCFYFVCALWRCISHGVPWPRLAFHTYLFT